MRLARQSFNGEQACQRRFLGGKIDSKFSLRSINSLTDLGGGTVAHKAESEVVEVQELFKLASFVSDSVSDVGYGIF